MVAYIVVRLSIVGRNEVGKKKVRRYMFRVRHGLGRWISSMRKMFYFKFVGSARRLRYSAVVSEEKDLHTSI